jgi:hypothetical protein
MLQLPYFGIHEDADGIRHLHQGLTHEGFNYVGIREGHNQTTRGLKFPCSHAIVPSLGLRRVSRNQWAAFQEILTDPLVMAMLPIPKEDAGVYYLSENKAESRLKEYLTCLENLNTPMLKSVLPFWSVNLAQLKRMLYCTNLHPLVLTGAQLEDSSTVHKYLELAAVAPRKLIISGAYDLIVAPGVPKLEPSLLSKISLCDLISLHMEHLGAEVIRRYCQKTPINRPMDDNHG